MKKKVLKKFAEKINAMIKMTSAEYNSGIDELFKSIAKKLLNLEIDEDEDKNEYEKGFE